MTTPASCCARRPLAASLWRWLAGLWLVIAGPWRVVAGRWLVVAGRWLVVAGLWLVAAGLAPAMAGSAPGGPAATGLAATATSRPPPALLNFTADERRRISQHGPWPPPPARDAGNGLAGNAAAVALGQRLFFDARLSPDGRLACASCHLPALAFSDGQPRSAGRTVPGPAEPSAQAPLDRNAPSLWNAGHQRWYGWDGAFDSLWSQALHPLMAPREMAADAGHLARVIAADADLNCRWRQVFGGAGPRRAMVSGAGPASGSGKAGDESTERVAVGLAKALGAFVASLVSGRTPFDDFRDALARNDRAAAARYPVAAQRGLRLFVGRGRCSTCHVGPLFSNGEFGDIGLPFFVRPGVVDPGRHDGITALRSSPYNLLGPWADVTAPGSVDAAQKTRYVDQQQRNFGEFKLPSLRNVAATAPYMHDGQLATLDAVLNHYSTLDLDRLHADGEQILQALHLSRDEHTDLLAFLTSLSDPRATRWRATPDARPCRLKNTLR